MVSAHVAWAKIKLAGLPVERQRTSELLTAGAGRLCSVYSFIAPGLGPLQLLHRPPDPQPHDFFLHITGSKAFVSPHGGFNVGCFAILLNKLIGGAVDVKLWDHLVAIRNSTRRYFTRMPSNISRILRSEAVEH